MAVQLSRDGALEPNTVFKRAQISSSATRKRIREYCDRILRNDLLAQCASAQPLDVQAADEERRAKKAKQRHDQREHWTELNGVLDKIIGQLEQRAERAERVRLQGLKPWSCPAGCAHGAADCGRLQFRQRLAMRREAIEVQQERLWEAANPMRVLVRTVNCDGDYSWQAPDWSRKPSFACSDTELAETQQAFLSMWDGRVRARGSTPRQWLRPLLTAAPPLAQVSPERWLEHWLVHGEHLRSRTSREYHGRMKQRGAADMPLELAQRGERWAHISVLTLLTTRRPAPDQYGYEELPDGQRLLDGQDWPVSGPIACARRGCSGCCYCYSAAPLPVYLQAVYSAAAHVVAWHGVQPRGPQPVAQRIPHASWVTVEELRAWVDELDTSSCTRAVPVYLLHREMEWRDDGWVLSVAGDVRNHVSTEELSEWASRLERSKKSLHVLISDSRELVIDDAERTHIEEYLSAQAAAQEQMDAEMETSRQQASEWREQMAQAAREQAQEQARKQPLASESSEEVTDADREAVSQMFAKFTHDLRVKRGRPCGCEPQCAK